MIRTRRGRQHGTAIIEFALVLPLLLTLIFTTIDFGIFFFIQHTVQFATREGARLALVGRTLTDASGSALDREASIVKTIRDKASIAVDPGALEISIFPIDAGFGDPADWRTRQDAGSGGTYMRVRTIYSYRFLTPVLSALVPGGRIEIRAQATYRNEWF
ncbi:MAG TPA: TadE family protein [Candidatus Eisenbacteria bacterium]